MNYEQAKTIAACGYVLRLPGWDGYFKYDYVTNDIKFRNGDYKLSSQELKQFNLDKRNNWYYIT